MSVAELPKTEESYPTRPNDSGLLLDSLEIKNFRAFRHLTIEKLGRVNLITGKNNVGKTALLEAISLFARAGTAWGVGELLRQRGYLMDEEFVSPLKEPFGRIDERLIEGALSLFNQHDFRRDDVVTHRYKDIAELSIGDRKFQRSLTLRFQQFAPRKAQEEGNGEVIRFPLSAQNNYESKNLNFSWNYPLPFILWSASVGKVRATEEYEVSPCLFISSCGMRQSDQEVWFKTIAATPLKDELLEALQIIEPKIQQVDIGRIAERDAFVIRMKGEATPIPITRLGEGMGRLFGFALGMVNVEDGILLIDEFENGLHYSVQPEVWRFIFRLAQRLNVQVFATTHSWECIEAFQQAAAEYEESEGALVKLQARGPDIVATVFDEQDLAVITRQQIEVR